MKKTTKPDLAIQKDVGTKTSDGTTLKNLWLEIPAYCNLACAYCYAEGGYPNQKNKLLTLEHYISILEQGKMLGLEDIAIPGAGEPSHSENENLTMEILKISKKLGLYITLFTTGEFITENIADKLIEMPVEIMLKGNSLNPKLQDRFVSNPKHSRIITGYGEKRNSTIELLISKGFNSEEKSKKYNRKSRMALVTSIMTSNTGPSNYEEMSNLLRYCRNNNIIFDVDSILKIGRGTSCDLCEEDQRLKTKLQELQEIDKNEYGIKWELSQSYIGTVCDRYSYHMYINQHGEIRPCIGANEINLGNTKEITLEEAWNKPEMKIIRNRKYKGKCGEECANFNEIDIERTKEAGSTKYKCNSCLGRRVENLTNKSLLEKGYVQTIGC